MTVKLEQEHNEKLFVLWLQSCPSSLIHTHSSKWIAFFSTMVTQSIGLKKKHFSHHPPHYFKWLVCTNDLLKWKPTYFLSQKKKKVPTINNDPVLWKDNPTTMEFKRFFLLWSYRSWYTRLHRTLFNRKSKNQMQTNSNS